MRPLKNGCGCSLCRAADKNVGKRRCKHILDNASMVVRHNKGVNFIDISGMMNNEDTKISIKASETQIKGYISSLSKGLSEDIQKDILAKLREEG